MKDQKLKERVGDLLDLNEELQQIIKMRGDENAQLLAEVVRLQLELQELKAARGDADRE